MRRLFIVLAVLLLPAGRSYGQVELIVRMEEGRVPALQQALRTGPQADDAAQVRLFEGVTGRRPVFRSTRIRTPGQDGPPFTAYVLAAEDSAAFRQLRRRWQQQPGVKYVQPNYRYRVDAARLSVDGRSWIVDREIYHPPPTPYDDPFLDSLKHLRVIRAVEAWEITTGAEDVRVGIIDTGIWPAHPDLAAQLWVNPGEDLGGNGRADPSDYNGVDDDGNGYVDDLWGYDFVDRPSAVEPGDYTERDPHPVPGTTGGARGHGTVVAGVLSAALDNGVGIAGVAPGVRLVSLRALAGDGFGDTDDIAAAIVYAAEMDIDVLNLSFGRDVGSPLLEESIQYAVAQGVVVVASAGNDGGDDPHYPSDYPEVISVGWLNADGTGIAFLGEYGVGLDLGAPASGVFTTVVPPENDPNAPVEALYGRKIGSSVAAPQVAGAAALLRSLDPGLSPEAIRSILTASAIDIGPPGWDRKTAAGRLDVANALARSLPARTKILRPSLNAGLTADRVAVVGTAIDPSFVSYSVFYAEADTTRGRDVEPHDWQRFAGPVEQQTWRDTLAVWDVGALPEGAYVLRLAVRLKGGSTVEDRRRVFVDRSAPALTVHFITDGLVRGRPGVVAGLSTDDLTTARMRVTLGGRTYTVTGDRRARRHALAWPAPPGQSGRAHIQLTVTSASSLQTTRRAEVVVPPDRANLALFSEKTLEGVPAGYLLRRAADFDRDGLKEIIFNRYEGGVYGDTTAVYEWSGGGFARAFAITADVQLLPRDLGDSNGNGRLELLLSQVSATALIEQGDRQAYPNTAAALDTVRARSDTSGTPVQFGRITDLDGDGRGELLGEDDVHWHLYEHVDGRYREVARLGNPTERPDGFGPPNVLTGDFDGDGRRDLLVGDSGGDWILYEARSNDRLEVVWTRETPHRYAGRRFARGDFDGDGTDAFVTYAEGPSTTGLSTFGFYYLFRSTGDDAYHVVDSLIIQADLTKQGAMTAADFDGNGRDELAILHPPALYVLAYDAAEGWQVRYRSHAIRTSEEAGMRSQHLTTADFDLDGAPELIAATADGRMWRFAYRRAAAQHSPPRWVRAAPRGTGAVALAWRAPSADSVTVYRSLSGKAFDPFFTTTDSSRVVQTTQSASYRLRAWYGSDASGSPLSDSRTVHPHAPATLAGVTYPGPKSVRLLFSQPLASGIRAAQFRLDRGGVPEALLRAEGGRAIVLRFMDPPQPRRDTLRWQGVHDATGLLVKTTRTPVHFPISKAGTLILSQWKILDEHTVRLTFSEALDPEMATDAANYRVRPVGQAAEVAFDASQPRRVTVRIAGVRIGPTGRERSLTVTRMRSRSGATLAPEGHTIRLTRTAEDLAGVYVYPNPYRQARHAARVTIAGLPEEATVQIFSIQGTLVRRIDRPITGGGLDWNLTDRYGERVPSGIYLVRVSAPGEDPVIEKLAVIR